MISETENTLVATKKPRELILLSPSRLPTQHTWTLTNEDAAAFLNGYLTLWHPAVQCGALGPPRIGSPYDYEQPRAQHIYAVPDNPPLFLPDDWDRRVQAVGAIAFRATADRLVTLENMRQSLWGSASDSQTQRLLNLPSDRFAPFFGIGFGFLAVTGLFEAMEHGNVLASAELWAEVQQAVAALSDPDSEAYRQYLQAAADRLLAAREVLYPVNIYLLDLFLLGSALPAEFWPASLNMGLPMNLIASASELEKLARAAPEHWKLLLDRIHNHQAEVCGGIYQERDDALLPMPSQLWNLRKGLTLSKELMGDEIHVYARKSFAFHPQTPLLLQSAGLQRTLFLTFDDAVIPSHRACVVNWPSPDGKQVEAFTRVPYSPANPLTFIHISHYLHQTIMQDHAATLVLLHKGELSAPWYRDWLELSRFGPVLGQWTTFSRYFNEVLGGEYASAASADDFHGDALSTRTSAHEPHAVSGFARHARWRRRIDTAWTLAGLHRGLAGRVDTLQLDHRLAQVEDQLETLGPSGTAESAAVVQELEQLESEAAAALAARLLARATSEEPGYLVLNPCSFTRRVAVEVEGINGPLLVDGPIKACQLNADKAQLVVEVPPLGFAWFPRSGPRDAPPPRARIRLADERHVRNEFFEAEIDVATGGLRAIRDQRTRISRLGQQLIYHPGSSMRAHNIQVKSSGPALGEVVTQGDLLDDQGSILAQFRQRFRAWLGRPVLDLHVEIEPIRPAEGYPWHEYYGARFAWNDERTTLLRGVNGVSSITQYTLPITPDYLELRLGRQSTTIFPGGLPFHQRYGSRMLDVILIPEGEIATKFDLALGLDREYPMQTALGLITPVPVVPTSKGPPHVGATGWLFHLDNPQLLLTSLRPAGADAITAHLQECGQYPFRAELRCVRNPQRALLLDVQGQNQSDVDVQGDTVVFEVPAGDLAFLRVEFS